jgi:tetratricopeptide (TPR) repeat protein
MKLPPRPPWPRLALLASLALVWPAAAQESPGQPATIEEAVAQQESYVAELRRSLDQQPDDENGWLQLLQAEGMLGAMRRKAGLEPATIGPEGGERAQAELAERVMGQWIARSPDRPEPYLGLARAHPDPERRMALLRDTASRFADHAAPQRRLAEELVRRGQVTEAEGVLSGFTAAHPDDPEGFEALWGYYERQGNLAAAREARAAWLALDEESPEALRALLDDAAAAGDETAARRVADRVIEVMAPVADWQALGLCEGLMRTLRGTLALEAARCVRVVMEASGSEEVRTEAQAAYARVMAGMGDLGAVLRAIEALPADQRPRGLLSAGSALAFGSRCGEAVTLYEGLRGVRIESIGVGSTIARALASSCNSDPAARRLVMNLLAESEPGEVPLIAASWKRHLSPAEVEPALRRRLASAPGEEDLWRALDEHYAASGDRRAREELLRDWVAAQPGYPAERYVALAELLPYDRLDEAVDILEEAVELAPRDPRAAEALASLYLVRGDPGRAADLADRLARSDADWAAGRGRLLLARLAVLEDDPATALDHYRALAAEPDAPEEAFREMASLLVELDRTGEALEVLDQRFAALARGGQASGATRDTFLARELTALGLEEEALTAWMRVLAEGSIDAEGVREAGELAERLERWPEAETAYRHLVELDPTSPYPWDLLARLAEGRGDQRAVRELAAQARGATGAIPSRLGLYLGRALRQRGELVEAITVLREARRQNLFDDDILAELTTAYRQLARRP